MSGSILKNVDNDRLIVCGGSVAGNGAYLMLSGKDRATVEGVFALSAKTTGAESSLQGTPTGTLTWAGSEVERVVAQGDGYVRYASGLQMCWVLDLASSTTGTWTFPVAFITRPTVTFHAFGGGEFMDVVVGVTFSTEWATFKPTRGNNISTLAPYSVEGIAIGRWK